MASLLRLHVGLPLIADTELELPEGAVRHVQVRRLQPGDELRLFDGRGHECAARMLRMGRSSAAVQVGARVDPVPELPVEVTLALGVPTNERMDGLVEKATELGVARIQPLITERSVLRLSGDRAERRVAHWLSIASAAAEQCGRATVPQIAPWTPISEWLTTSPGDTRTESRWLLSPSAGPDHALHRQPFMHSGAVTVLSGPEGGLSAAEERRALEIGFTRVSLGTRVLRADTAPLAVMAWLSVQR